MAERSGAGAPAGKPLNPTLRHEDREALNDIAVAVIDRSQSQLAGKRMKQADEAEAALKSAAATLGNTELRVVTVHSGLNPQEDGTRLFTALNRALGDIPPERFAGAVLVTDGQVHDVPPDAAKSGINGPVHGLLTGSQKERDRRVVIEQAPRFGIVGNEQILRFRVDDVGGDGSPIDVTVKLGTGAPQSLTVTPGVSVEVPITLDHGGQNIAEIVAPPCPVKFRWKTTAPSRSSKASATACACCWCPASPIPASAPGAIS